MKFKHIKSIKKKPLSLIIISQSKTIKQIRIYRPIIFFLLLIIILSLSFFGYKTHKLYQDHISLQKKYDSEVNSFKVVSNINEVHADELKTLRKKTVDIEQKLLTISKLQLKVEEMVGLENTNNNYDSNYQNSGLMGESNNSLLFKMDELSITLDQKVEDLSNLITDVNSRLKYLDAKPNRMPTTGRITSKYGWRKNPFGRGTEFHYGLDIANNYNTVIKAAGKGVVTFAGYTSGYGRIVIISHGFGYESVYGHNKKLYVKVGDKVEKGEKIAAMGNTGRSTGTHLHFEVRYYGKRVNPSTIINNTD